MYLVIDQWAIGTVHLQSQGEGEAANPTSRFLFVDSFFELNLFSFTVGSVFVC